MPVVHCVLQVLLVQGYLAKSGWGFPKGKVNKEEAPHDCAAREVTFVCFPQIDFFFSFDLNILIRAKMRVYVLDERTIYFAVSSLELDNFFILIAVFCCSMQLFELQSGN